MNEEKQKNDIKNMKNYVKFGHIMIKKKKFKNFKSLRRFKLKYKIEGG